ncbi:MAG TPA: SgcJ/EcaC family oxidoreductase [Anaerolineales bacterium]|nr:SgcJ/EcaC family oxidoreductase [Anaerolineales bacterium]
MNEELKKIRKQRTRWIDAINKGSASDFVSVLAEDVVWFPSLHNALNGKEQIQTWLEKPFAEFKYEYSVSEVRIRIAGDWAVEQATFSTRAWTNSGKAMPIHEGMYTILWRKNSKDEWLIERYIDHSADFEKEG